MYIWHQILIIMNKYRFSLLILLISNSLFSQDTICEIQASCSNTPLIFSNSFDSDNAETGPDYGCLDSRPNPVWYYLGIENSGLIDLRISQTSLSGTSIDADFICYGPFDDPFIACENTSILNSSNIVSCSFSGAAVESFSFNVLAGEFYILLITNFDGQEGTITLSQTNLGDAGAGSTDCSLACSVSLEDHFKLCVNQNKTLITMLGNQSLNSTATYEWFKKVGGIYQKIIGETNSTLNITGSTITTEMYKVEMSSSLCSNISEDEIQIDFIDVFINFKLNDIPSINFCTDQSNDVELFDLTINNDEIANTENQADYAFTFYKDIDLTQQIDTPTNYDNTANTETIYVSIKHKTFVSCIETVSFEINVIENPVFNIIESEKYICTNLLSQTVQFEIENLQDNYTLSWKDENGNEKSTSTILLASEEGNYTITATSIDGYNCKSTKLVYLLPAAPTTTINFTMNEYWVKNNFSIDVIVTGSGIYQYAIDDDPYQEETRLVNISPGIHTIYVKEMNDCGITSKKIKTFGYRPYFSPNGDGKHDIWKVQGINFQPTAKIYIFDRYGKLIHLFYPANNEGWNGLYNGKTAPEGEYWFTAEMANYKGEPIIRQGHFSLIRTNN